MSAPHQVLPSAASRLCMPMDEWPECDRRRWAEAQQPAMRRRSIHDPVPAGRGRRRRNPRDKGPVQQSRRKKPPTPQRLADFERAYGLWLRYLTDRGVLDLVTGPGAGAINEHVDGFVAWLQGHCKPATVHTYLQRLLLAQRILAPADDWSALANLARRLTPPPPDPTRRLADVRHPAEFLALAEHLMATAEEDAVAGRNPHHAAILYRDGLILAVLVFAALRRGSLLHLALGTTLHQTDQGFLIVLGPEHTKGRRPEAIPLHHTLTEWMECYLTYHRPLLVRGRMTPALWIAQDGKPLQENGVWHAVGRHTETHLGVRINPHFIRHCIGTTVTVEHPDAISGLPAVLQHRCFRVTERHYILARQLEARTKYGNALNSERARLRDLEGDQAAADEIAAVQIEG